jgi:hypothetical protein
MLWLSKYFRKKRIINWWFWLKLDSFYYKNWSQR